VAFFFEPEYAEAARAALGAPAASSLGEQYALGALVYFLLTGRHYLDFSLEREELLRQIAEDQPVSFAQRGFSRRCPLEAVVFRALEKDSRRRYGSTREFADAFHRAVRAAASEAHASWREEPKRLLDRVLDFASDPRRPLEYYGPASPSASITYGSAGIAYALYRLAAIRDDAHLLALADAWAERAADEREESAFYNPAVQITPETVGRISPYHTASGVAAVQALIAHARGDKLNLDLAVDRFLRFTEGECDNADVTLGICSVLLALILIMETVGGSKPQLLMDRADSLYARVLDKIRNEPSIGNGDAISYLGIAHGWAGLLYTCLRWSAFSDMPPPPLIDERLSQLAALARFTKRGARWPVQAGPGSISLAGWCNGTAGHAHLWSLASRIYSGRYLELAERSAMDAYEGTGGGHGLCCGFAGQAYAQLSLYRLAGEWKWLDQARELTAKAAAFGNAMPQRHEEGLPLSLYKGDFGVAVLAADIERPEWSAMPFFE